MLLAQVGIDMDFGNNGIMEDGDRIDAIPGVRSDGLLVLIRNLGGGPSGLSLKPDGTYGSSGYQIVSEYQYVSYNYALAKDDSLFMAYNTYEDGTNPPPRVRRYLANGLIDPNFALTQLPVPGPLKGNTTDYFFQNAILVDSKNRAYVVTNAGYNKLGSYDAQHYRYFVDRLLPTGKLDTSFGDGGRMYIDTQLASNVGHYRYALDSSDRLIVSYSLPGIDTVIRRFTTSGKLDTGFATQGSFNVSGTRHTTYDFQLNLTANDQILVAYPSSSQSRAVTIRKYTSNGQPVTAFGQGGTIEFRDDELGKSLNYFKLDDQGRMLGGTEGALFRLLANGTPDKDMGDDGVFALKDAWTYGTFATGRYIYVSMSIGDEYGYGRLVETTPVELNTTRRILYVLGDAAADSLSITKVSSTQIKVVMNGQSTQHPIDQIDLVKIELGSGNDQLSLAADLNYEANLGEGDDSLTASAGTFTLNSGAGHDRIQLADGNDVIYPGKGNDSVIAGGGDDYLEDGYGNNTVHAGDGDDLIRTGDGHDSVLGGDGRDTIKAAGGNDYLDGQNGRDRLYGSYGNDTLIGGGNNDRFYGGPGADLVYGGGGDDYIVDLRDTLDNTSIDSLYGGDGVDAGFYDDADFIDSIEVRRTV